MDPAARRFIEHWLGIEGNASPAETLPAQVLERLRQAGFTGAADPIELTDGYFFGQSPTARTAGTGFLVATQVRWVHGSPGLLVEERDGRRARCSGVGVFVGSVPAQGIPFEIG